MLENQNNLETTEMADIQKLVAMVISAVQQESHNSVEVGDIPIGVSNRHIHLSQADLECLFGVGHQLTPLKELSQKGQFACKETLILCGPKGAIEKVRVLGPVRPETQVEVMAGDGFKLGVNAPVRMSGDLKASAPVTLVGPKGSVCLKEGMIVAQRHIHMHPNDAKRFGVENGDCVSLEWSGLRGGVFHNVAIRVSEASTLECHLDVEEANAMLLDGSSKLKLIKTK